MAVTVQTQFESVVTEMYQEAFVGSSIENGTTLIKFDLRKRLFAKFEANVKIRSYGGVGALRAQLEYLS